MRSKKYNSPLRIVQIFLSFISLLVASCSTSTDVTKGVITRCNDGSSFVNGTCGISINGAIRNANTHEDYIKNTRGLQALDNLYGTSTLSDMAKDNVLNTAFNNNTQSASVSNRSYTESVASKFYDMYAKAVVQQNLGIGKYTQSTGQSAVTPSTIYQFVSTGNGGPSITGYANSQNALDTRKEKANSIAIVGHGIITDEGINNNSNTNSDYFGVDGISITTDQGPYTNISLNHCSESTACAPSANLDEYSAATDATKYWSTPYAHIIGASYSSSTSADAIMGMAPFSYVHSYNVSSSSDSSPSFNATEIINAVDAAGDSSSTMAFLYSGHLYDNIRGDDNSADNSTMRGAYQTNGSSNLAVYQNRNDSMVKIADSLYKYAVESGNTLIIPNGQHIVNNDLENNHKHFRSNINLTEYNDYPSGFSRTEKTDGYLQKVFVEGISSYPAFFAEIMHSRTVSSSLSPINNLILANSVEYVNNEERLGDGSRGFGYLRDYGVSFPVSGSEQTVFATDNNSASVGSVSSAVHYDPTYVAASFITGIVNNIKTTSSLKSKINTNIGLWVKHNAEPKYGKAFVFNINNGGDIAMGSDNRELGASYIIKSGEFYNGSLTDNTFINAAQYSDFFIGANAEINNGKNLAEETKTTPFDFAVNDVANNDASRNDAISNYYTMDDIILVKDDITNDSLALLEKLINQSSTFYDAGTNRVQVGTLRASDFDPTAISALEDFIISVNGISGVNIGYQTQPDGSVKMYFHDGSGREGSINSNLFGWGVANISSLFSSATASTNSVVINSSSFDLEETSFSHPTAVGNALSGNADFTNIVSSAQYRFDYGDYSYTDSINLIDEGRVFHLQNNTFANISMAFEDNLYSQAGSNTFSFQSLNPNFDGKNFLTPSGFISDNRDNQYNNVSLSQDFGKFTLSSFYNNGNNPIGEIDGISNFNTGLISSLSGRNLLSDNAQSNGAGVSYKIGKAKISVASYTTDNSSSTVLGFSGKTSNFSVRFTEERGALLGGIATGAFEANTNTTFLSVSKSYHITPKTALKGVFGFGLSQVSNPQGTILQNYSDIHTNAASIGIVTNELRSKNDSLQLNISMPLAVSNNATVEATNGITTSTIGLTPDSREINYEATYSINRDNFSLNLGYMFAQNQFNQSGNNAHIAMIQTKFAI